MNKDIIYRQAAIDAVIRFSTEEGASVQCTDLYTEINSLPSAQSERKKGRWIDPSNNGVWRYDQKAYTECSVCGKKQFLGYRMNYCPNCGADMRGEEDEVN